MSEFETINDAEVTADEAVAAPSKKFDRRRKRRRAVLIAIILILLLSLCAIAAVLIRIVQPSPGEVASREEAGGIEWVRSIYGFGPALNQQFVKLIKVEVGDGGTIYATDRQHDFVMQFNPDGTFERAIGEDDKAEIFGVGPVAEGDGQLFFGQASRDRVLVYTQAGEEESRFVFPSPNDIEHSGDRVAISSNVGFVVFDGEGNLVREVGGEQGTGDDQFDVIAGLAYGPDGTLYVVDSYNNRIMAYDDEGNRLWMTRTGDPGKGVDIRNPAMAVGRETTAPARLQFPVDAVVDGAGRLIVVDGLDFSISVFDTQDGKFLTKYGDYGTKDGQLFYPTAIDYDAERDWFVVADGGNRRIQIIRIEGSSDAGGAIAGAVRRMLSGPLRALLFPLILLLLIIAAWWLLRKRKERRDRAAAQAAALESESGEQASALDNEIVEQE